MAFATCTVLDKRRPLLVDAMISDPIFTSTGAITRKRGIQRRSTAASAGRDVNESWRKALLVCGVLSSLLYGAMIGMIGSEGYSRISQTPSELTAIGAPTRSLWMLLGAVYTVLVTAFGWGVWTSAGRRTRLVSSLARAWRTGCERRSSGMGPRTAREATHVGLCEDFAGRFMGVFALS